jgi:serine/threonine-protein kinase
VPEWVHLDIKPANLFLDGLTVRVGDWGIAKQQARLMSGETAVPGGTRDYISPDQLAAWGLRQLVLGGRSALRLALMDLYSVGVVAYEIAVGQPAYAREFARSSAFAEAWSVRTVDAPRIAARVPQCPKAVSDLLASWISTDPRQRIGHHVEHVAAAALAKLIKIQDRLTPEQLDARVGRDHVTDPHPL